jgi:hypothetical protein
VNNKSYNERLRFFRKNADKTRGVALSLTYIPNSMNGANESTPKALFEIAPLLENTDKYDWSMDSKILINLAQKEILDFICLAQKKFKKMNFYHTPQKAGKTNESVALNCEWNKKEKDGETEYSLAMYFNRNKDKKLSITLSQSEVEGIKIAMEEVFRLMLSWTNELNNTERE